MLCSNETKSRPINHCLKHDFDGKQNPTNFEKGNGRADEEEDGDEGKAIIRKIDLGNLNRFYLARVPARSHARNETISRLGPLRSHPPNLRCL